VDLRIIEQATVAALLAGIFAVSQPICPLDPSR
jgi:hypothetical protein